MGYQPRGEDPEPIPAALILDMVLVALEVEPEEGRLSRAELDRVMSEVYGPAAGSLPYYRQAWRNLLASHLSGWYLGRDRRQEDAKAETERAGNA